MGRQRRQGWRTFFPLSGSLTLIGLTSNMMQHTSIVSFTPFGGVFRLFTCREIGRARRIGNIPSCQKTRVIEHGV